MQAPSCGSMGMASFQERVLSFHNAAITLHVNIDALVMFIFGFTICLILGYMDYFPTWWLLAVREARDE